MSSMGRNIKHWILYQIKTAGITFGLIIALCAFVALVSGDAVLDSFFTILPVYLTMMATFSIIVNGFTGVSVIFPITVSFGAKRKESIYAMTLSVHLTAIVEYGVSLAALLYVKPQYLDLVKGLWPAIIAVICMVLAFGNLVAMLSNKYGRMAGMICYIVIVLIAAVSIGFLIGMVADKIQTTVISVLPLAISTVAAIVMIGFDALSTYLLYKSVKVKDLTFVS